MRRLWEYFLLAQSLAVCFSVAIADEHPLSPPPTPPRHDTLIIRTHKAKLRFDIDIAETPEQQEYGLMHRTRLPDHYGMLFILPAERDIAMWMKDTPSPLDMLFIDSSGKVVYIAASAPPESTDLIHAGRPVRAVLELPGGIGGKDGIKVGDKVMHSFFRR